MIGFEVCIPTHSVGTRVNDLPSGWRVVELGDVAHITMGQSPKSEFYNNEHNGLPFLQGSAEFNSKYPTYKKYSSKWNREAEVNSILMSVRAPVGSLNIATMKCAIGRGLAAIKGKHKNTGFIYFLLKEHSKELDNQASGTVFTSINKTNLEKFKVKIPPLPEQKAIAHILGKLDDKIELNRQINQTLETMAQTLFKSWFVDFDPVIDNAIKAGNKIPKPLQHKADKRKTTKSTLPKDLQALFPDSFVFNDTLKKWIPDGWEAKKLGKLITIVKGKSYRSNELKKSKTALVTLKSFMRGGGYRLDGLKEYIGQYKPEQEVFKGDLIIAYTDVTQAADVIGKAALIIGNKDYNHLVASLDVGVIRPYNKHIKYFIYGLTKTADFQANIYAHSTGTTVLHLQKDAISNYLFPNPEEVLFKKYSQLVKANFDTINENIQQNKTLTKLRDTLLPKLISGKIRV